MSRLGKRPIAIPSGVTVTVSGPAVSVAGKTGTLKKTFSTDISIAVNGSEVQVSRSSESKRHKELHGLTWALITGMVEGIHKGFKKELDIIGVGWNAKLQGKKLVLQIGFCHTVDLMVPEGVKVNLPTPQRLEISGIDKQAVGEFAAVIRKVRPPEPYQGKGIRYTDEHVIRKVGKSQVGK
jgi:large subunit ribosomal protein L6